VKRATKLSFVLLRAKRSEAKRAKSRAREEENEFKNEPLCRSQFSSKKTKKQKNKIQGGFAACKALSQRNDEPHRASRPWDQGRDGFVMGGKRKREGRRSCPPPFFLSFPVFFPLLFPPLFRSLPPPFSLSLFTPHRNNVNAPPSRGRRRPRARVARARPRPGRHHPLRVRRRSARLRRPPHDGAEAGRIRRARVHRAGRQSG